MVILTFIDSSNAIMYYLFLPKDQFTVHGEEAALVNNQIFNGKSVMKYWGDGLATLTLTKIQMEAAIRELLNQPNSFVELWQSNRGSWQIARKGSPGNMQDFQDILFDGDVSSQIPVIMCLSMQRLEDGNINIFIAFADLNQNCFGFKYSQL